MNCNEENYAENRNIYTQDRAIDTSTIEGFIKSILECSICNVPNTIPLARQCPNDLCNFIMCCSCYDRMLQLSRNSGIKCPICTVHGIWEYTGKLINVAAGEQIVDCIHCSESMCLNNMENHILECHSDSC